MDLSFRILPLTLLAIFLFSCAKSSQIYLQPENKEYGFFTNDSFFITCYTTEEKEQQQLTWLGTDKQPITADEGRIHIQPVIGEGQGLELVFEKVEHDDYGQYVCSDVHNSLSFNLIVYRSISFSDTPKVQHAPEGENAGIMCHVKSEPNPVVSWYFNGTKLENGSKYTIGEDSHHELIIHNISRSDAGYYKCNVYAITYLKTQTKDFDILVQVEYSPEWSGDSKNDAYASIGSLANITCAATGQPSPMFQWSQDGNPIYNSSDHMISNSENGSVLQVQVKDESQFRTYTCRASNQLGSKEKNIELKEGSTPVAPKVLVEKEDKGDVYLSITMPDISDNKMDVFGYKVKYALKSDPSNSTKYQDFDLQDQFVLKNMSYNSKYIIQVAAHNEAGHGDYSEEVIYETQTLQVAQVVHDMGSSSYSSKATTALLLFTLFVCSM